MILDKNAIDAVLRDAKLTSALLAFQKLTLEDYKNYQNLTELKQAIATDCVLETMKIHAPFKRVFPSPTYSSQSSITLFGTRGIYILSTEHGGFITFVNKRVACAYASEQSRTSVALHKAKLLFERT